MSRDRRSSRKRSRDESSSEELSGEIKKIRALPAEKRIVESKINEGRESQIVDIFSFGANDSGQLGFDPVDLGGSASLRYLKKVSDLNCISYTCAKDSSLVVEGNKLERYRNVYSWGGDESVLARDMNDDAHTPARIEFLHEQPIIQVAAGSNHVNALTSSGEVYSWGIYKNNKGKAIGFRPHMPKEEFADVPEIITELEDVKIIQLACTNNRSLALSEVGEVYEWGNTRLDNKVVQRHVADTLLPSKVLLPGKICAIYAEANGGTIFAEATDGTVYSWGTNQHYQCGIDKLVEASTKTKDAKAAEERKEQKLKKLATHSRPSKAKVLNKFLETEQLDIKKISSGKLHSVLLATNGKVYTWGDNTKGQLGLGSGVHDIVAPTLVEGIRGKVVDVSSGAFHTLALTQNGDVYGWGVNKDKCLGNLDDIQNIPGQLNLADKKMRGKIVGVACGSRHNLIIAASE